jgi:hypothetical protein
MVEMSLVLVIVGLLVGGVLVGNILVESARMKGTISQYERFNTAALTFKGKYNLIPGDVNQTHASQFGFTLARSGANGMGDEDGLVEGSDIPAEISKHTLNEAMCFWKDLAESSLGDFIPSYNLTMVPDCMNRAFDATTKNMAFPSVRAGYDTQWIIFTDYSTNYFALTQYAPSGGVWGNTIPPSIAQIIDAKIDDGMPLTGNVRATDPTISDSLSDAAVPAVPASGVCVSNADTNPYNFIAGAKDAACSLRIRAAF